MSDQNVSPEIKLFLCLSKNIIQDRKKDLSEFFEKNAVDWGRFKTLAIFHELLPFFYAELKGFPSGLPEDFLGILTQNHHATLIRSQKMWRGFLSLADAFTKRNLSMVPVKGISTLADIYRERPLRVMADIDILVKKEELSKVKELLTELGYEVYLGGLNEEYWTEKHCELTFYKHGTPPLDVHFGLDFERPGIFLLPHLWERIRSVLVDGREVWLLSPEDEFFALALHQRRYGGKTLCLKNIFDLAMILIKKRDAFDWSYVLREAHDGRMRGTVFFALCQAKTFFDSAIPEFVWKELRISHHKREAVKKIMERDTFSPVVSEENKELYLKIYFLLFDSFWEPVRYILNIPLEQFAKFYNLAPYARKTKIFYWWRLPYIAWQSMRQKMASLSRKFQRVFP